MGGNALAHCTRRFEADEYYEIAEQVLQILERLFPESKVSVIKSYRNKSNFGDLDVLLESDYLPLYWIDRVAEAFNSKDSTKNGNILSAEYKDMQVDIIATPEAEFQASRRYFDYNDLGNLLGRVAHNIGLKLGHDGLSYNWRLSDNHVYKTITLLTDWKDILPVLGYDYERYSKGFDTLEDIFEFVISSRFFYKDIYLLQNRNHTSRVRDAKRKTYMEFLDWIEDYEEVGEQIATKMVILKASWLNYLFVAIPNFKEQYAQVQAEYEEEELYKGKFNGDLVREWTGLENQELGKFMKWHNNMDRLYPWKEVVLNNPIHVIEYLVGLGFERYKEENGL